MSNVRAAALAGILAVLAVLVPFAADAAGPVAGADPVPRRSQLTADPAAVRVSTGARTAKAAGDTLYLMGPWGSGAQYNGQFESADGSPDWNGWTSIDESVPHQNHWQVSTYFAETLGGHGPGNRAAYCGDTNLPACHADTVGGYGNAWYQTLTWRGEVADPSQPCAVVFDARLNYDTEIGYDYLYLRVREPDDLYLELWFDCGTATDYGLHREFTVQPGRYAGRYGDEVIIDIVFVSDGSFSDDDCLWPTHGAVQIDDISVSLGNGGPATFDDFEDGTLGNWEPWSSPGVGDFAQIRRGLGDIDPCATNLTPQACFIDDGQVVPGTGGSMCINWCYGPLGYIVTTTGGLAGPEEHLYDSILSPVMAWPGDPYEGLIYAFDVFVHEDLTADAPGIFYFYSLRSTASADPGDIASEAWKRRDAYYYGGPEYRRTVQNMTDLLEPGLRWVQVRLTVWEAGYYWGWTGDDGYPAPYFDNLSVAAFAYEGPTLTTREIELAGDGFPASGTLDLQDLGANSVRFDMADHVALVPGAPGVVPGDSIVCTARAASAGSVLVGPPRLHYRLRPNPLFDPYRSSGQPNEGAVDGAPVMVGSSWLTGRYCFDLPDSGFFFPGDVIHYYLSATDEVGGAQRTVTLPSDTTGFCDFSGPLAYDASFTVRALPSLREADGGGYRTPGTLWWYDAETDGMDEWQAALVANGMSCGERYDLYRTGAPTSGLGNGLGGRATVAQLQTYHALLYSSGGLDRFTFGVSDGIGTDPGDDLGLVSDWLALGGRRLLLTGDHLAADLHEIGGSAYLFVTGRIGVNFVTDDAPYHLNGQQSPLIVPDADQTLLHTPEAWLPYVGCRPNEAFDLVYTLPAAVRLACFTDPSGDPDVYPYAAATLRLDAASGSDVVYLPYDLAHVWTPRDGAKALAAAAARAQILGDVLAYFGADIDPLAVSAAPAARALSARSWPNPFNPRASIAFETPRDGRVTVELYDVRGRCVRRLLDEVRAAGPGSAVWDGRDDAGREAASGMYFYQVRSGDQTRLGKMVLIR